MFLLVISSVTTQNITNTLLLLPISLQYISILRSTYQFLQHFMEGLNKKNKKIVKASDFAAQSLIGSGSFGKVRLVRRKKDLKVFCMKTLKKASIIEAKQVDHVINQCQILAQINHPMIVNFEGISQDHKYLNIYMEYVPGGQLFSHLSDEGLFQADKTQFYTAQIILVFQFLHQKEIIYRDLKPENILIAKDGYIKLTDFGFAKKIEHRTYTLCGTPEYLAPEILLNQGHGKAADWWTLGILIYQMLTGSSPFRDSDTMGIYHRILKGKLRFPKNFDSDAKSLVKHLLVSELSKRYGNLKNGVQDIKNHRFLSSVSFSNILNKKVQAQFKPKVKSEDDVSNFMKMEDSMTEGAEIPRDQDPFLKAF